MNIWKRHRLAWARSRRPLRPIPRCIKCKRIIHDWNHWAYLEQQRCNWCVDQRQHDITQLEVEGVPTEWAAAYLDTQGHQRATSASV